MEHFYVEDSNLPVASLAQSGIVRLSDSVPSDSLTEAATIHAVSKAFYPAEFSSNLAVSGSNFVSTAVYPVAAFSSNTVVWSSNTVQAVAIRSDWASNVAVFGSNLSSGSSNTLFPLVDTAITKANGAQSTADAGLAAGTAAGVTAAGASAAAIEANSLAASATALATANQATLTLHDVRITHAKTAADAASSSASSAQQTADKAQQTADQAQQTACNAFNKTKYWDFTQDSILNLQQPTLELTFSNDAFIHVNKSLQVTDSVSCDGLLAHTWRAPDALAELRYDSNSSLTATCDALQVKAVAGYTPQFSVSNGTCYVASNLQMSNTAVIQAVDDAHAGVVKVTPDALRFYTASNGLEKLVFSANSNGLFALPRCALFGATETSSNFARLEMSLADGLRFGSGIESQLVGPDRDLLRIDSNGDISCYNRSSGLLEGLTSKASISKGTHESLFGYAIQWKWVA